MNKKIRIKQNIVSNTAISCVSINYKTEISIQRKPFFKIFINAIFMRRLKFIFPNNFFMSFKYNRTGWIIHSVFIYAIFFLLMGSAAVLHAQPLQGGDMADDVAVADDVGSAESYNLASHSVPSLIRDALSRHPALRAQTGMNEAAQAAVQEAKWQYWPTPSISVERAVAGSDDSSYGGDSAVVTLRLQQPLWTGGRLDGALAKAEAQKLAAQADFESTRRQLALRIIQTHSDAVAAQGKITAYEQSREVHARLLDLVVRRAREGVSAQADIDLARSRLAGVDADLAAARAQLYTALDKLTLLVGRSVTASSLIDAENIAPPEPASALDALLSAARETSPQIAKARAQSQIADADLQAAQAALFPELSLRAERQYGNFSIPDQRPQNRAFIGFSSALGSGLASFSGINAAQARQRAAREDIETQRLTIDEQVQGDIILYNISGLRRNSLERVRQSSADVYASWERQFLAGRKQWQDLMNAAREQAQNDLQLADAVATRALTGWRLAVLTQGVDAILKMAPETASPSTPVAKGDDDAEALENGRERIDE